MILWVNHLDWLGLALLIFPGLAHTPMCGRRGGWVLAGPEDLICVLDRCAAVG